MACFKDESVSGSLRLLLPSTTPFRLLILRLTSGGSLVRIDRHLPCSSFDISTLWLSM